MLSLCLLNFTFSCQQESGRIGQASRPRCPPDEGRQGPKCGHQRPTGRAPRRRNIRYLMQAPEAHRTGKIWSRIQTPEAHEKREDLVPNPDTRGSPEEGRSGPEYRHQRPTRRRKIWSQVQAPEEGNLVPYAGWITSLISR